MIRRGPLQPRTFCDSVILQGRRGRSVVLYIKKWIECEDLSLKSSHKQVKNL